MKQSILAAALMLAFGAANAQNVGVISGSESNSDANSSSHSGAAANSQSGGNEIKPNQQVGVTNQTSFQQTFEAADIPRTTTQKFKTNNSVPLAAAVSFSSDYCGGTASGGLSGFGISAGLSAPKMDGNCQALRRAEKFGTAAANAYNAGLQDMAAKLIAAQVWEICHAGDGPKVSGTDAKCQELGLYTVQTPVAKPAEAQPQQAPTPPQEYQPRQPRGEVTPPSDDSKKTAAAHTVKIKGSNGVEREFEVGPDGRMVH